MRRPHKRTHKVGSIATVRWAAYSAAAAASSFAGAGSAEAVIHYSGVLDEKIGRDDVISIPVGSGGAVMTFFHRRVRYGSSSDYIGGSAFFSIYGASGKVAGDIKGDGQLSISNLARRDAISLRSFPENHGFLAQRSDGDATHPRGRFQQQGYGFIGFTFNSGAGDQYGWVRVRMEGFPSNRFYVVDFASADPGESISAGQKSGSMVAMESLGGLALGAAGACVASTALNGPLTFRVSHVGTPAERAA